MIMYKTTELEINDMVKKLKESELGFLLLQADDKITTLYDALSNNSVYGDKHLTIGDDVSVTYYLYNLAYNKKDCSNTCVKERSSAVANIFKKWTDQGYNKHHAKSPFGCGAFLSFLDDIEYTKADYLLLRIE